MCILLVLHLVDVFHLFLFVFKNSMSVCVCVCVHEMVRFFQIMIIILTERE